MGNTTSSIANKLSSSSLDEVKSGLSSLKKEFGKSSSWTTKDFFRTVLKPLGTILSPAYPGSQRPVKAFVLSELLFLADIPNSVKPTNDFTDPLVEYVIRPLLRSTYEKEGPIQVAVLTALDRFATTKLLGDVQEFVLHSSKFFRIRELNPESAVVELDRAHQAARNVSAQNRELLVDLLLEKIHFETEQSIQEALLNEAIFILQSKWHPFTKDQCLTLFSSLLGLIVNVDTSKSVSFSAMQHLVSSQKLSSDMLGKLLRSIDTNLTVSKQTSKSRQFQVWNVELLRSIIPQLDSPGASCDQELVNIFQLARQICYTDFSSFGGFDKCVVTNSKVSPSERTALIYCHSRAYLFCEVIIDCIGLLPSAKGTSLAQLSEWPSSLWTNVIFLMTWPFFLSRPNLLRALNSTVERLWPHGFKMLLLFLSQSIMAMLMSFLHPKRLADLVGITNDIEAPLGIYDVLSRIAVTHTFSAANSSPLNQLLAEQSEREIRREIRRQFAFLTDYRLEDKVNQNLSDSGGPSAPAETNLDVAHRQSVILDPSASLSASSSSSSSLALSTSDVPSRQQIQRNQAVLREFFQALNSVKAALVSFFKNGLLIQKRSTKEIEELMIIFNDRLTAPAQLMLLDMWNKVLSHLMLLFEEFSRGVGQNMADIQLKEAATRQIQDLSSRLEKTNTQIVDLQRERAALKDSVKALKKENERIVETFSCAVCFENLLARDPVCLDCGHLFCAPCVDDTRKNPALGSRCPLCRQAYTKVIHIKGTQQ